MPLQFAIRYEEGMRHRIPFLVKSLELIADAREYCNFLHHDSSLPRSNCRLPFIPRLAPTRSTGVKAPPNTGRRSATIFKRTCAAACPTSPEQPNGTPHRSTRCGGRFTTIAALRISRNLLCPILVYRLIPDTPRFGEELMAIDTSGDRPGNVIADIPHDASALGVALTRRPREIVKTYDALGSLLPGRGEAAGGVSLHSL